MRQRQEHAVHVFKRRRRWWFGVPRGHKDF
jgi:hypothetical protein